MEIIQDGNGRGVCAGFGLASFSPNGKWPRRERPHRRPCQARDELTPPYRSFSSCFCCGVLVYLADFVAKVGEVEQGATAARSFYWDD
jgi:hypothetical protein